MELRFFPINIFRETPKVTFFDAGIEISNASDVVIHSGEAMSPPDDLTDEQYYVHNHQIDHNLVIEILFWTILISYLGLRFTQTWNGFKKQY